MCSSNNDSNSIMPDEGSLSGLLHALCRKCDNSKAVVVLQKKFPYCQQCLIEVVSHKFFSSLGKAKILKPTDRILILFSGSQSSSCLLHLVTQGARLRKKKVFGELFVLFVDDGCFVTCDIEDRINIIHKIRDFSSSYDLPCYYSPLVFSDDDVKPMGDLAWCTESYLKSNLLYELSQSVTSTTSKQDLLEKMRTLVAAKVAKKFGCTRIFSAETADHIAAKVLSNVALGRGAQLPQDVGFSDTKFDTLCVRPLRECSRKEVAFYNFFCQVPYVLTPKFGQMAKKVDNIQKLSDNFIINLQMNFPSTVHAVIGTANKLTLSQEIGNLKCPLCKGVFDIIPNDISAVAARELSHHISTKGFLKGHTYQGKNDIDECDNSESIKCRSCDTSENNLIKYEQIKHLCYGCQQILSDLGDAQYLPKEVFESIECESRLTEMRSEIEDFLL